MTANKKERQILQMKIKKFNIFIIVFMTAILLITAAGCSNSSTLNSKDLNTDKQVAQSSTKDAAKSVEPNSQSPVKLEKATVTHHTDGDTVGVTLENGQTAKVRLIGVNTPEFTTKHEQYGEQASDYTKSQLYGQTVYLESDAGNTDRYGRLLRYVWISPPREITEDEVRNKMFNAILAYNGYAEQMTVQPNVKYAEYFRKFCADARENNRGLWSVNPNGTTKGDGTSAPSGSTSSNSSTTSSSRKNIQPSGSGKIKGNINSRGEKIYHVPGQAFYDRTSAEEYFNTEAEAQAAGYRRSKR
ncbi:thermonuclease family protein [Clostridium sp. MT-113]|uniref:Thermonuclease family protein n=2 Tax=Clostridiaceae TaxID=31979 RepID=A0ABV4DWN1_9CLOT